MQLVGWILRLCRVYNLKYIFDVGAMRNHLLFDGRMIFSSLDGGDATFFQILRLSSFSFVFAFDGCVELFVSWSLIDHE